MDPINPIETCEVPEGFQRTDEKGLGPCLSKAGLWINHSRHWARLSGGRGKGPFHVRRRNPRLDLWVATFEEAIALAR